MEYKIHDKKYGHSFFGETFQEATFDNHYGKFCCIRATKTTKNMDTLSPYKIYRFGTEFLSVNYCYLDTKDGLLYKFYREYDLVNYREFCAFINEMISDESCTVAEAIDMYML